MMPSEDEEQGTGASKRNIRAVLAQAFNSFAFEGVLSLTIALSIAFTILEADYIDQDPPVWLWRTNAAISVGYAAELLLRVYAFGLSFFRSRLNVCDFVIVVTDATMTFFEATDNSIIESISVLRGFRTLRLARGIKVVSRYPSVSLMVKGLVNGVTAALFGSGLMLAVVSIFSIAAVRFLHPVNVRVSDTGVYDGCERCPRAFMNVRSSMLTFMEVVVMGDNWGSVMIPIMEEAPEAAIFFGVVFISVHFMIMNVILAVIVDIALKASQEDVSEMAAKKEQDFDQAADDLKKICKKMDQDGSGDLTEDEIVKGFDANKDFRDHLLAMDIKREDVHLVFSILDADRSGTVNYEEFIQELFKMKRHDSHTLLVLIKHYVTEIRRDVQEQVRVLKQEIFTKVESMEEPLKQLHAQNLQNFCPVPWTGLDAENTDNRDSSSSPESVKMLLQEFRLMRSKIREDFQASTSRLLEKHGLTDKSTLAPLVLEGQTTGKVETGGNTGSGGSPAQGGAPSRTGPRQSQHSVAPQPQPQPQPQRQQASIPSVWAESCFAAPPPKRRG